MPASPSFPGAPHSRRGIAAVLLTGLVFLVALNLRPTITAVGPVIGEIGESFGLGEGMLGLLGSLPLIMFAVVSPLASWCAARVGIERVIWVALILIAVGLVVRSFGGAPGLWAGTAVATGAIALANVLVPVVVRNDFPRHMAIVTGVYSACIGGGAALASAVAPPVSAQHGWRWALVIWVVPAVLVALLWIPRAALSTPLSIVEPGGGEAGSVWRSPSAWWLTGFMGLQSANFYFTITWLPSIEIALGRSAEQAGMTLFWYQAVGLVAGLFTPLLLKIGRDERWATYASTVPVLCGFTGLLLLPQFSAVWAVVVGCGSGVSLVVALSIISMRGRTAQETAELSGMVQSFGYLIAALAPFGAGVLVQMTGRFQNALILMLALVSLQMITAHFSGRRPDTRHTG